MSVLIGHASIDENKKISGGKAGNQTGKELCTRKWYANNWNILLRCKNKQIAEYMAMTCEKACKNKNIGYDQSQRNTLRTQAIKCAYDLDKINKPCETDCSAFMAVCAECSGVTIPYSGNNAPTTRTMRKAFESTGMFEVLTDPKYLTKDTYLKRGDILVKEGHHTVMVLENGTSAETQKKEKTKYVVGQTYTTSKNLYIREQPYGEKMKFSCITADAQKKSKFDEYGCAILQSGTKVTCKAISQQTNSTWMLIPSGWICAIEEGKVYIS